MAELGRLILFAVQSPLVGESACWAECARCNPSGQRVMPSLEEAVNELRAEYCQGCQEQYTKEEILNGKQCEFCDRVEETGRMVADLQD